MKELKDYIHLYIGCGVKILCEMPDGNYTVSGVVTKAINEQDLCRVQVFNKQRQQIYWLDIDVIHALILRPLESMTPEERSELIMIVYYEPKAFEVLYLLKKGFDLFGLKDAGLAVYETDLTP